MEENVKKQQTLYEEIYAPEGDFKHDFHTTPDPLIRYLRDRRMQKGVDYLKSVYGNSIYGWKVLVVCGGVGGEGMFFYNNGFKDVTVSDISENALKVCQRLAPDLKTSVLNCEEMALADNAYDLVVVQDGLHHLPRPVLGFTEMLRVARKGIIVIEGYDSFVGNRFGTNWEVHGDAINWVFRWDRKMIAQVVKSYLLQNYKAIKVFRFWDHNVVVRKVTNKLPQSMRLKAAKAVYALLGLGNPAGNMMVAVVLK